MTGTDVRNMLAKKLKLLRTEKGSEALNGRTPKRLQNWPKRSMLKYRTCFRQA